MQAFSLISIIKILVGMVVLALTYTTINIYEDPLIGISLAFLGIFITSRGASYFLFVTVQKRYRTTTTQRLQKDSYKLSLLFGIFVILNFLLITGNIRNKRLGLLLLGGFIALQMFLFTDNETQHNEQHFPPHGE